MPALIDGFSLYDNTSPQVSRTLLSILLRPIYFALTKKVLLSLFSEAIKRESIFF